MSAEMFYKRVAGKELVPAFEAAVSEAQYDYGHRGYTGTIAEKTQVVLRSEILFTEEEAERFADTDMDDNKHDKWGPAWAVKLTQDGKTVSGYWLYGWASA